MGADNPSFCVGVDELKLTTALADFDLQWKELNASSSEAFETTEVIHPWTAAEIFAKEISGFTFSDLLQSFTI